MWHINRDVERQEYVYLTLLKITISIFISYLTLSYDLTHEKSWSSSSISPKTQIEYDMDCIFLWGIGLRH